MRELTSEERSVIRLVIDQLTEPHRGQLLVQLQHTVVRGGTASALDLGVAAEVPPVQSAENPLPVNAVHEDASGAPLGFITVWTERGYLSALEYGWVTDDPPGEFPPATAVRILPDLG